MGFANIRNYVLHPYKMIKDLRTMLLETTNVQKVLDGDLDLIYERIFNDVGTKIIN